MRFVIDRIVEGIAVCEELTNGRGERREFKLCELPEGVKEGDVLVYKNNKLTPNPKAARERQIRIKKLMNDVFR